MTTVRRGAGTGRSWAHTVAPGLLALVLGSFVAVVAAAQTYRIEPGRTSAGFTVTEFGIVRATGQFGRASGTIVLDPSGYGGSIDVNIDTASVETGWTLRDEFLRGENMFDVAHYPIMRFRSTHLEYRGRDIVAAHGLITLRGVTRPVRLDVTRLACATNPTDGRDGCDATVTGHLLRRSFGMVFAYPLIGDEVELDFAITAFRVRDNAENGAR